MSPLSSSQQEQPSPVPLVGVRASEELSVQQGMGINCCLKWEMVRRMATFHKLFCKGLKALFFFFF